MNDPQAAYLLLLICRSIRANFFLRAISPDLTEEFAARHDSAVWRCLCTILGTPSVPEDAKVLASLSFSSGGLGLASAFRVPRTAHFASWADNLQMVRKRHPYIAATMIRNLEAGTTPTFEVVTMQKIPWWQLAWRFLLGMICRSLALWS